MFSTVMTATLHGMDPRFVKVEADASSGLPMFHMVGYLSSEVKEASERVKTAIKNTGINMPPKKMVINLSPADLRKRGTSFDLPIAVALLGSMGILPLERTEHAILFGELGLDGSVRKVAGVLPMVLEAQEKGFRMCMVPQDNVEEVSLVGGMEIVGVQNLAQVCEFLKIGRKPEERSVAKETAKQEITGAGTAPDYLDIFGQEAAKRAIEVAVAGRHHLLFVGSPGCGKTMLAKRIPTIFPALSEAEIMELTKIYSAAGMLDANCPSVTERPFREVHHTVTKSALVGGGLIPSPGEITLASKGVLFLDEIAEIPRAVLETLRQPLESREVRIVRSGGTYRYPADCLLVGAMNPCPCGNYPDRNRCNCTEAQIRAYQGKLSQPLLDRIDICAQVTGVKYEDLRRKETGASSAEMRSRVCRAWEIQKRRFGKSGTECNAQMDMRETEIYCRLGSVEEKLMQAAFEKYHLTARSFHKILRVARTIADLEGEETIRDSHILEAISYRTTETV